MDSLLTAVGSTVTLVRHGAYDYGDVILNLYGYCGVTEGK